MANDFYLDADDRRLAEWDTELEMEVDYLDELLINEDIQLPVLVLDGVAYYDDGF